MTDFSDLDDLYAEAKAAVRASPPKAAKTPLEPEDYGLYRNLANWTKGRGIALIHAETETLLGHFTEYTHKTDHSARRLVREAEAAPVSAVEYILGDWWLLPEEVPQPKRLWKQTKLVTIPFVKLLGLGVHAHDVAVYAAFGEGRLERLDLAAPTFFGGGSSIVTLAVGVDIRREVAPAVIEEILTQLGQPI